MSIKDKELLPMTGIWTNMKKMENMEYEGQMPMQIIVNTIEQEGKKEEFQLRCGKNNYTEIYESSSENIYSCWDILMIFVVVFAGASIVSLKFIDKDKR